MAKGIDREGLVELGLDGETATALAEKAQSILSSDGPAECWSRISREDLSPEVPFEVHQHLYAAIFADWDDARGPRPAWTPPDGSIDQTNIGRLMTQMHLRSYEDFHRWTVRSREEFWQAMIRRLGVRFKKEFSRLVESVDELESPRWLPGAEFNIADSCFITSRGCPAIVYQREGSRRPQKMSYGRLESLTNRVANGLVAAGYSPGDAVACYVPMTAEAVAMYLGIVKAGCVVVSIADSFAPDEVAKRLRIAGAKGLFTQDVMLRGRKSFPLYEKAVAAEAPRAVVLQAGKGSPAGLRDGDTTWDEFLSDDDSFESVARSPHDHMNILFSSGTTGDPKAIPWSHTTPIKCAVDGHLHQDIQSGEVVAWPSSLGWMMGPWLIYATMMNSATMALYYGSPTTREFARFVEKARVNVLGLVPSLVKAWRERGAVEGADWSLIRAFSSTGECSGADDYLWLMSTAGYKPVIEYCGGTEIGGGYITGTTVQPASPATFSTPAAGLDLVLMDDEGKEADAGEVFLIGPSIGLSTELLNRDHREVYFEGTPRGPHGEVLRRHGDQIEHLGAGFYRAHGRADDTMNLGGIKVSSAEIERTVNAIEGISETAAIAVPPAGGGPERLVIYAVLEPGAGADAETLKSSMQAEIKSRLNPLFRVHEVVAIDALPRTASNKVMRRSLRASYGKG